jgi:transcriptional regulator with XRE-family HTH domain
MDQHTDLGTQLRAIRRRLGWSLEKVEHKSDRQFKAVVVGSWERGDLRPCVEQVQALLAWYGGWRLELLNPGDVVVSAAKQSGQSYVEYVVTVEGGRDVDCANFHEAVEVAAQMPGSRIAYRTHIVGDLTYVDGEGR